jgi:hypothetical protein
MLYTLTFLFALLSATFSQNIVKFSDSNSFGSDCSTSNEISEIDGSDGNTILYYCFYFPTFAAGLFEINFYKENDDTPVHSTYWGDEIDYTNFRYMGSVYLSDIIDESGDSQNFVLKFLDISGVRAEGYFTVINGEYANIADMSMRFSAPSSIDEYGSSGEGSVGDGSIVYIESYSQIAYYCAVYEQAMNGYSVQFHWKGLESDNQINGNLKEITSNNDDSVEYTYYYCDGRTFNSFMNDNNIEITSYYYDSDSNELDSKTITINFNYVGAEPETTESVETTEDLYIEGFCSEKPGKRKNACYSQYTKEDCEAYNKCQWIDAQ